MPQKTGGDRGTGTPTAWIKPKPIPKKPTKAKTQAEMSYPELVSKGPGYGSQASRVANQSVTELGNYIQSRTAGSQQNPASGLRAFVSPDSARGTGGSAVSNGSGGIASTNGGSVGGGGGGNQYIAPTGSGGGGAVTGGTDVPASIAGYGFTPEGYNQIYQDPSILAAALLETMGITNTGLAQSLGEYFNPAYSANFILNGGNDASMSDANTMGYINDYMQQMVTPNGSVPQFDELLNAILGATQNDNSLLGAYMGSGPGATLSTDKQIQQVAGLIANSLSGMNGYAQSAYSQYLKDQESQYRSGLARSDPGATSYGDYINANWNVNR